MPSYQGAKAAIEARLRAAWGTTTPIAVENGLAITKTDAEGENAPWIYLEIEDAGSTQQGVGVPGNQLWAYDGLIAVHVFVPVNSGTTLAGQYADQIGEIFRAARFYADVPGYEVRCWSPRVGDRGPGADDGLWWRTTATIPFTYWHRG